ncbi:hypothetical protein [Streptomyces sp. NPDC086519]|uniref:hypothetical protein n=1 Tax=Streptomyces sp. NPDC086519 TaxID=3154863 RepID=UPI0034211BF4
MNAAEWNACYPVGSLVFAYPGARPEDIPSARRLVTRTSTEAQSVGLDREGVVWVEGNGAYIALTHVDPVTEAEWNAAKAAEAEAAALSAPSSPGRGELLSETRLLEIRNARYTLRSLAAADRDISDLLDELDRMRAERHVTNEALSTAHEALRVQCDRSAGLEQRNRAVMSTAKQLLRNRQSEGSAS